MRTAALLPRVAVAAIASTAHHLLAASDCCNEKCVGRHHRRHMHSTPYHSMGILDDAKSFLSGLTLRAEASHILVKGTDSEAEEKILAIKKEIGNDPAKFAKAAAQHSDCPSGQQGGSLGEFGRYSMVPEFDQVVFNEDVGVVHGPIKTNFGFHLILIERRND